MCRAHATVRRLVVDGRNLLLVGHGASVMGLSAALCGEVLRVDPPPPPTASLTQVVFYDDRWHLVLDADTSHLH